MRSVNRQTKSDELSTEASEMRSAGKHHLRAETFERMKIQFHIGDSALYVANSGSPFTRTGVIAVCASHLSDKTGTPPSDNFSCRDEDLALSIRERELATYSNDDNRIVSDFNAQFETEHDYQGRFVWEMLQNADDSVRSDHAGGEPRIGSKGLGFKSVLEIAKAPEIHSGPFHFFFSAEKSQQLLRRKTIAADPPPLTFRLPHSKKPDSTCRSLLDNGYTTIIRLPYRDGAAKDKALQALSEISPLFLLFSNFLSEVEIAESGLRKRFEISRESKGFAEGRCELRVTDCGAKRSTTWQRWVRVAREAAQSDRVLTAAICLPLDSKTKRPGPHDQILPLYVFFPTEETLQTRALIHASFDVQANRKHLREGLSDGALTASLSEILETVLNEVPSSTSLTAFAGLTESTESELLEGIRASLLEILQETPFVPVIGGGKVVPEDAVLWTGKFGEVLRDDSPPVMNACLLAPELLPLAPVLKTFGAEHVGNEHCLQLMRFCRNQTQGETIQSLRYLLEQLLPSFDSLNDEHTRRIRSVPCWWTIDGIARSLDASAPLLLKKPAGWPAWLAQDSLDQNSRKVLLKFEKSLEATPLIKKNWSRTIQGFLLRKNNEFLGEALVPAIEGLQISVWKKRGWDILEALFSWQPTMQPFEKLRPLSQNSDSEELPQVLGRTIRYPTQNGWVRAFDCYAGEAWEGPAAFDRFFGKTQSRGVVKAWNRWPVKLRRGKKKAQWKMLLRYCGVSWEPKVRELRNGAAPAAADLWRRYSKSSELWNYRYPIREEYIDHFPEIMNSFPSLEREVRLLKATEGSIQGATYRKSPNGPPHAPAFGSFARFQLRSEPWLRVKRSILFPERRLPPDQTYLPEKGLSGLLPEVSRGNISIESWWSSVIPLLKRWGVRKDLSRDVETWRDWMIRLHDAARRLPKKDWDLPDANGSGAAIVWKSSRALYKTFLRDIDARFRSLNVPCRVWTDGGESLDFAPQDEVRWLDESYLTAPQILIHLLRAGIKFFIFSLSEGSSAKKKLGIRPLSQELSEKVIYESVDEASTARLRRRYSERRAGLSACVADDFPMDSGCEAVRGLKLELSYGDNKIADVDSLSWKDSETGRVLVRSEPDLWRSFADALTRYVVPCEAADKLENLLRSSWEEYRDRLKSLGVSDELLNEIATSKIALAVEDDEEHSSISREGASKPAESHSGETAQEADDDSDANIEPPFDQVDQPSLEVMERSRTPSAFSDSKTDVNKNAEMSGRGQTSKQKRSDLPGKAQPDSSRKAGHPDPITGRKAEDWLHEKIASIFDFVSVTRNERDALNRESDIVVRTAGVTEIHIEVKHLASVPSRIYWSDLQIEKAHSLQDAGQRYAVALLKSVAERNDQPFAVYWIWNPLLQFLNAERSVQWVGHTSFEKVAGKSWAVEEMRPESVPAKRFRFAVRIAEEILELAEKDSNMLDALRREIENPSKHRGSN